MIKNPTELNIVIQNLKDGNLDDSLKKIKKKYFSFNTLLIILMERVKGIEPST